ncbi:MAG TPA: FAD-binding oxidoreductase [Sphingomicrobium sp.]|nr:FAD-binding oxidoreductase [Sphingomicrobium sp.]
MTMTTRLPSNSADRQRLIAAVRDRFGERTALTDPNDVSPWTTDWRGRFHGKADAILEPKSTEEVSAIVVMAGQLGVPLVPQGGNTSMVGGATPPAEGSALILSLRRMNRIRSISAADGRAIAEAGVVLAKLHDAAAEVGKRFPLTLGARGSCTIGGLISTNAGGTQVLRFGTMRSLVAGVEAVLPDGSVHSGLTGLKKDNRGYSLDQLLVGAEGTLGIVTAAALRLVPAVASRAVAWVAVASPQAALSLLRRMESDTDQVEGFELVPDDSLTLVLKHVPGTRPPLNGDHPWHVLVEATAHGDDEDPAALIERLLASALDSGLASDAVVAASEAQAEAFWKIRDSISEAERAEGPTLAHDISVAVEQMPGFMIDAASRLEQAFPGVIATGFGHLGDGNVHFHVRGGTRARGDWHDEEGPAISRMVHDLVTAAGGSISAEHGIGQMKRDEFERLAPPGRIAALRHIKQALDPRGIMNPGKLVP